MATDKNIGVSANKEADFSEWYSELIIKSEIVDYTSVSGCFAFRPYGYAIWELLVEQVDKRLKKMGVKNVYFPMFIPEKLLMKEQEHVEGFAPEVAWVTHAGNSKLDERLAVRPTSETIMYESYAKWVRSWRDLPIKYNQWNNVVRWEFKHPTPLIRTREFLWCEGHSAFATRKEAEKEIKDIMKLWTKVTEELLCLKGLKGKKSEAEKFAGAISSHSIEYLLPNGKTAQGPDAHFDGQNFAKAFGISFLDKEGNSSLAWQNTWAITTRMIGIMAMVHGDSKGLILPPSLAPIQAVVVPITFGNDDEAIINKAKQICSKLKGIRWHLDMRDERTPGWKFNEWELKGVPVRVEIGPKDIEKNQVVIVTRHDGKKIPVAVDQAAAMIKKMLKETQGVLFEKSFKQLNESLVDVASIDDIATAVKSKKVGKGYFCGSKNCEEKVKQTEAKSLCITSGRGNCINCGRAGSISYFGKSY